MADSPLSEVEGDLTRRPRDRRSGRVVFLSHCILNENTRYLGGACRAACVREVVEQCFDQDLGIVQMPCPEQMAWGGVLKRHLLRAYGLRQRHPLLYRLRHLLIPVALWYTRRVYRRLARQVGAEIADYQSAGFAVAAIVGIDGSPTCGVERTIDLAALDALASTPVATMTAARQNLLIRESARVGRGLFIEELRAELLRRRLSVPLKAHDLLAELEGRTSNVRLGPTSAAPIAGHPS